MRQLLARHGYEYVLRVRGNDVWVDPSVPWARRAAVMQTALAHLFFVHAGRYYVSHTLAITHCLLRACRVFMHQSSSVVSNPASPALAF